LFGDGAFCPQWLSMQAGLLRKVGGRVKHSNRFWWKQKAMDLLGAVVIAMLVLAGCSAPAQEMGVLEGSVTMTMLPVAKEGLPEPSPAPEAWAVRHVVISSPDGKEQVAQAQIGPQGTYRVELPVGAYSVDINHTGMDQGIDLPRMVEIHSDIVTRLDIKIDTRVR
jgi:hypothetical protein